MTLGTVLLIGDDSDYGRHRHGFDPSADRVPAGSLPTIQEPLSGVNPLRLLPPINSPPGEDGTFWCEARRNARRLPAGQTGGPEPRRAASESPDVRALPGSGAGGRTDPLRDSRSSPGPGCLGVVTPAVSPLFRRLTMRRLSPSPQPGFSPACHRGRGGRVAGFKIFCFAKHLESRHHPGCSSGHTVATFAPCRNGAAAEGRLPPASRHQAPPGAADEGEDPCSTSTSA